MISCEEHLKGIRLRSSDLQGVGQERQGQMGSVGLQEAK